MTVTLQLIAVFLWPKASSADSHSTFLKYIKGYDDELLDVISADLF